MNDFAKGLLIGFLSWPMGILALAFMLHGC
jgi:hypothetical protein